MPISYYFYVVLIDVVKSNSYSNRNDNTSLVRLGLSRINPGMWVGLLLFFQKKKSYDKTFKVQQIGKL